MICFRECVVTEGSNPSGLRGIGKQKTLSSGLLSVFLCKWCHQESNRGHKDFQSFALPTELWHHCCSFASAKVARIFESTKFSRKKIALFCDFPHFWGFLPPESRFLVLSTNKKYSCSELFSEIICNFTIRFCAFAHADACKPEFFLILMNLLSLWI